MDAWYMTVCRRPDCALPLIDRQTPTKRDGKKCVASMLANSKRAGRTVIVGANTRQLLEKTSGPARFPTPWRAGNAEPFMSSPDGSTTRKFVPVAQPFKRADDGEARPPGKFSSSTTARHNPWPSTFAHQRDVDHPRARGSAPVVVPHWS